MYRISILAGAFLLAIIGLVFLQGGRSEPRLAAVTPTAELTDVTDMSAPMPAETPREPAAPAPAPAPVVAHPAPAPAVPAAEGDNEMAALTAGVLAGLGVKTNAAPTSEDPLPTAEGDMRAMTSSVLAGLGLTAGNSAPKDMSFEEIIAEAVAASGHDAYLDVPLMEAADQGVIEVPGALRRADGGMDTATLINSLVAATSGEPQPERPAAIGGEGVEVRMIMEAGRTVQVNFYTVQDGDSLGAIAHRFYGDASKYDRIFEANRRLLASPELIRKGQRLTIPNLDA